METKTLKKKNNRKNYAAMSIYAALGMLVMAALGGTIDTSEEGGLCGSMSSDYPKEISIKKVQCLLAGGDIVCEKDRAGCYDIGSWDNSLCETGDGGISGMRQVCEDHGGTFRCRTNEISCEVQT